MVNIGVLALQGSFAEHLAQLIRLENVQGFPVRTLGELDRADAMILPGGESTALRKLMAPWGFGEALKDRIQQGMPVWGTCAGMILLADKVVGEEPHLGVLRATVSRNAYGTQLDSFRATGTWRLGNITPAEMILIRAPRFDSFREPALPAAMLGDHVIGLVQDHILATAFHPELTGDLIPYRWLADQVIKYQNNESTSRKKQSHL